MAVRSVLCSILFLFAFSPISLANNGEKYQNSALKFVENKAQWDESVLYRASLNFGRIYLQDGAIIYDFWDTEALHALHGKILSPTDNPVIRGHAFKVKFLNAGQDIATSGIDKSSTYHNYFIGNDKSKWASYVGLYSEVQYKNLYPKIDMNIYGYGDNMKYDLIVKPQGKVDNIQIEYEGVDELYLKNGELNVVTSLATIIEQAPVAYQIINGQSISVPCIYVLEGNILSFEFPDGYNNRETLIIDPTLVFSTYSGSTSDNWGFTATFDPSGNTFSGGIVMGSGFPTTMGAYQTTFGGGAGGANFACDAGILKYDSLGTSLKFATYLGGNQNELPHSMIVNSKNELLIYGVTGSTDFPTTSSAFDITYNGGVNNGTPIGIPFTTGTDIFISKLSEDGASLLASTYVGGTDNDGFNYTATLNLSHNYGDQSRGEIVVDSDDNIYVASCTQSTNFPVTGGVFQPLYGGGVIDGVVFKMDSTLGTMVWASFLGGTLNDAAYSLKPDGSNNVVVTGGTNSANFPVTPGVINPVFSGNVDGFVTYITSNGTTILHSTYIGTSAYDQSYNLALDATNEVYIFGQTLGSYPVTGGVYSNAGSGQFIHKMDSTLSITKYSTVFGSGSAIPNLSPVAFLVDTCQNVYVSGWGGILNTAGGNTNGMPITAGAFQSSTDGNDFYLAVFQKDLINLLYATYIGDNGGVTDHVDGGTSRFDERGIVYQSVCASCLGSSNFPTTPNAWSTTNNSSRCNNVLFKFDLALLRAKFDIAPDSGCLPLAVNFSNSSSGGVSYFWDFGDGGTSTSFDTTHIYNVPGVYNVMLIVTDSATCALADTVLGTVVVYADPIADAGPDFTICPGDVVQLNATGGLTYFWTPDSSLSNPNIANPTAFPTEQTLYFVTVTDTNGCSKDDSMTISMSTFPVALFNPKPLLTTVNKLITFTNLSLLADTFSWDFGDGNSSNSKSPQHSYSATGTYTICLLAMNQYGCADSICIDIEIIDAMVDLPTAFSPNGDNENDFYRVRGGGIVEMDLKIFNRWGQLVFHTSDINEYWDGTWNGKPQEMDVYVFTFYAKLLNGDVIDKQGNITLLR